MSDQDHSVRSLAEILREHGLESDAGTRPGTTGPVRPKRRRPVEETAAARRPAPDRGDGADDDRRTGARRDVGGRTGDTPAVSRPAAAAGPAALPKAAPRFGRRRAAEPELPTAAQYVAGEPGPTTAAIPGLRPGRTPGLPGGVGSRSGAPDLASTGPIPRIVVAAEVAEEEPLTAAQNALAWVRFVGELVLAVAIGVGVYYLFTVLWELLPYVAVVAAPLAITGMVGAVTFWRRSHGQGALETRVLLLLLFAATLLVVVPAAGLLAGT